MRTTRVARLVAVTLLVAAGCSGDRVPAPGDRSDALLTKLSRRCAGLGVAPARGQVTFVAGDRIIGTPANGARARCVAKGIEPASISWGGKGDRFLIESEGGADVYLTGSHETIGAPAPDAVLQGLSRPEGTQVVFVADGGRSLVKAPAEGGPQDDISFLARHDEAVYHPAGTHVAVVGEDENGNYGIFLATNEGTDVEQLVAVNKAREVYEPVFSHDGDTMYYVADHGGYWDLHSFSLSTTSGAVTEAELGTVSEHRRRIDHIEVSEFADGRVAFRVGDCDGGFTTFVHHEGDTYEPVTGLDDTEPVGWLPNGDLIVAATDDACAPDPTFDLYRARLNDQDLLVAGVTRPAIRAVLPPPPDPPGRAPEVIA